MYTGVTGLCAALLQVSFEKNSKTKLNWSFELLSTMYKVCKYIIFNFIDKF